MPYARTPYEVIYISSVVLDSVTTKDERPFMYCPGEFCIILSGTSVTTKMNVLACIVLWVLYYSQWY